MKWMLKAAAQKVISCLPWAHQFNFLLQRYVTIGKELSYAFVEDRLMHAARHVQACERFHKRPLWEIEVLEIGTGWYPIVPIALFLMGANAIETTDIRQLYNRTALAQALRAVLRLHTQDRLRALLHTYDANRIAQLKQALQATSTQAALELLQIQSTICSYDQMAIAANSKDMVISNNTLQYFPKGSLDPFFLELKRICKPEAILSLAIDLTDEYAQFDAAISPFNFYKYSERRWQFITSRLGRLNRLRRSDYAALLASHRFQILEAELVQVDAQALQNIRPDPHFDLYPSNDLCVTHARWVARIAD
jgi:SAM-dependent methyltransferase